MNKNLVSLKKLSIIAICERLSNPMVIDDLKIPRTLIIDIKDMWNDVHLSNQYWFKHIDEMQYYEMDFEDRLTRSQYLSLINFDIEDPPYFWFNENDTVYILADFFAIERTEDPLSRRNRKKYCKACYQSYVSSKLYSLNENQYWHRVTQEFCISQHGENSIDIYRSILLDRKFWCTCCLTKLLVSFHDSHSLFQGILRL